jgi:hypothetical protein
MRLKCSHCSAEADVGPYDTDTSDTAYKVLCPMLREEVAKSTGHDLDLDCPHMRKAIMAGVAQYNMDHHPHSDHDHGHAGHSHVPANFGAAFAIGAGLNLALVLAQLGFGYLSNSLALISDGVHNFTDVLGLLLARGRHGLGDGNRALRALTAFVEHQS